jgi:hypothetical protein
MQLVVLLRSGGKVMVQRRVIVAVFAMAVAHGCSRPLEVHEAPVIHSRIRNLASLSSQYANKHKRKPASIDELKAWLKKLSQSERAELRVEDPETALTSPRDNQSFVLVRTSSPGAILAYEKIGEGGKHYVVTAVGGVFELDDAELRSRVPSAK